MDFALARRNMVEGQIRTNRVTDQAVIEALESLPREAFLGGTMKERAYLDEDLTIAPGRIMMEPMVLARLLQAARIERTDLALVIAAASGYEAVVIAHLASAVVALENNATLVASAKDHLGGQGADTVSLLHGDLAKGHPGQGPYDVIFINGAVGELPGALVEQLAEGGRLVYVTTAPTVGGGKAMLVSKENGVVSETEMFDASIPALPEFAAKPKFNL
ncbi:MAG: protein-L-isoaspartate O-methyltransferase [Rhodospirillales bacterium]|nr:protein-L-isoaspartate O-methyltransferase [Rhodospirillales bacterium]